MKIWLYCDIVAQVGGETPIADSFAVYRDIAPEIRQCFIDKGLMYVHNYGNGLDLPGQCVFKTESSAEVETYCHQHGIGFEWIDDGELLTRQRCEKVGQQKLPRNVYYGDGS